MTAHLSDNTHLKFDYCYMWPIWCLLCGERSDWNALCSACIAHFPIVQNPCPTCAHPRVNDVCAHCFHNPPLHTRLWVPFAYSFPVDKLIHTLKYQKKLAYGKALGQWMTKRLLDSGVLPSYPDAIIPVPLHNQRLQERGFNQAEELARPLAKACKVPLLKNAVQRHRLTTPQAHLNQQERQKNLRAAFCIQTSLQGKKIMVVDDVITSGATTSSLTQTLLSAGAMEVWIIGCARALE